MSTGFTFLLGVQIVASFTIIVLVLLQQGKGADMGSAFGSGSAGSLFGATGAANFLSRATKWAAVVFFVTTLGLAYMATTGQLQEDTGIMDSFQPNQSVPAAPGSRVPSGGVPSSIPSAGEVPVVPSSTGTSQ